MHPQCQEHKAALLFTLSHRFVPLSVNYGLFTSAIRAQSSYSSLFHIAWCLYGLCYQELYIRSPVATLTPNQLPHTSYIRTHLHARQ